MKLVMTLLILFTILWGNISYSREAKPVWQSNKENWSDYQSRHCKWERGISCKTVPEDQGKTPPQTDEEIALDIGIGILSGGPTPQPKGFKFSIGKLPTKPTTTVTTSRASTTKVSTTKAPTTAKSGSSTEKTPLLSTTKKTKTEGTLRRVNGKIGYLLGDPDAPTLYKEPPNKRARIASSNSESNSESESESEFDSDSDSSSVKESDNEEDFVQEAGGSKFTIINRRSPIEENEIEIAIEEIESIYSKGFFHDTQLDINHEIESYNKLRSNRKVSFQDYFALRDYTEDGYIRINKIMRSKEIPPRFQIEIEQLTNALSRHSDINISLRNKTFRYLSEDNTDTVYRGEIRDRADFEANVVEEEIYSNDTFFSTTSDEEYAEQFNSENLHDGQVNIRYTIHYPKGLTYSTDVSDLLENNEDMRVFLPRSPFLVTEIKTIDDGTIEVEMRVLRGRLPNIIPPPVQMH
ncbi:ADP-ribosyltransferase [Yersinia ruckeri]|uniref:ADP-ribosyltransferase n=1 Tax=Yersinia ruckeri TaxID=29486 RepID=UPI002238D1E3|nr:ADP-ribosyltransferase [Yersinia ruckeri]MCW6590293.1 ADP-ribosyltransferase [Yersinia ruckeri]UZX92316.1 ADP-ribosyltransferase [Yersinia ruckeri]